MDNPMSPPSGTAPPAKTASPIFGDAILQSMEQPEGPEQTIGSVSLAKKESPIVTLAEPLSSGPDTNPALNASHTLGGSSATSPIHSSGAASPKPMDRSHSLALEETQEAFNFDEPIDVDQSELKKHRYTRDEDDIEVANLRQKIDTILGSLSDDMRQMIAVKRKSRQRTEEMVEFEEEAAQHGVNVQDLIDIKIAFEMTTTAKQPGVPETEFLNLFGEALCTGMNDEQVRLWFRSIDANCSGTISWGEISSYLTDYKFTEPPPKEPFVDYTIEGSGPQTTKKRHKTPIQHLIYNNQIDCYYTASGDGLVQAWTPSNLRAVPEVVHQDGEVWVNGIVHMPHNNRVMVLKADRSIHVYDAFLTRDKICHELYRCFATEGRSVVRLDGSNPFYDSKRNRPTAKDKVRVEDYAPTPASVLEASNDGIVSLDHLGGAVAGEPIVCGMESGQLHFINLMVGSTKPIKTHTKFNVHKGWVTQVHNAPELSGVITSSLDERICVTDLEKGYNIHTFTPPKRKPIFGFAYTRFHNILATPSGRSVHVWNALTGAKLAALVDHEAPVSRIALNPEEQLCYTLMENKTVKVWDLRMWKSLGTASDSTPRYPTNSLQCLTYCEEHHMLVTGCTELFGWRPADVQERMDAGLHAGTSFAGHFHPINELHVDERCGHITAVDTHGVAVWGQTLKKVHSRWKWPDQMDSITCSALDEEGTRLLVGTENARVIWFNYATGYRLFELQHDVQVQLPVAAVAVYEGFSDESPTMAVACVANSILGWSSDHKTYIDITEPGSRWTHEDDEAMCVSTCMADKERQVIAAAFSQGTVMVLTLGLAPLHRIEYKIPPERLIPVCNAMFATCHADGQLKFNCVSMKGYTVSLVASIVVGRNEESITGVVFRGERVYVADGSGAVSVFYVKRLQNPQFIRRELLPHLAAGDKRILITATREIYLIKSFRAHAGEVSDLKIMGDELLTAGADHQLRSWSLDEFKLLKEYGNDTNEMELEEQDLTLEHPFRDVGHPGQQQQGVPTRKGKSFSFAKSMEASHESGSAEPAGLTKALSFTRLASKKRLKTIDEDATPTPEGKNTPSASNPPTPGSKLLSPQASDLSKVNALRRGSMHFAIDPLASDERHRRSSNSVGEQMATTLGDHLRSRVGSMRRSSILDIINPDFVLHPPRRSSSSMAALGGESVGRTGLPPMLSPSVLESGKPPMSRGILSPNNNNTSSRTGLLSDPASAAQTPLPSPGRVRRSSSLPTSNILQVQHQQRKRDSLSGTEAIRVSTPGASTPSTSLPALGGTLTSSSPTAEWMKITTDRVKKLNVNLNREGPTQLSTVTDQLREVAVLRERRVAEAGDGGLGLIPVMRTFGVLELPQIKKPKPHPKAREFSTMRR